MEYVIWGIVIFVALGFIGSIAEKLKGDESKKAGTGESSLSSPQPKSKSKYNTDWLEEKQSVLGSASSEVISKVIPKWYFDDPTSRQLSKLDEMGLDSSKVATKGEASDLIGMAEPIEDSDAEVLRFFKETTYRVSQSEGRFRAALLLADEDNLAAFKGRPATTMQKEFYRFVGEKIPKGLTSKDAYIFQSNFESEEENESLCEQWHSYQDTYQDLCDPETREDYDLKKISLSVYREAYGQLKSAGKVSADGMFDMDELVEEITIVNPELQQ
jgi:hypothetical protein